MSLLGGRNGRIYVRIIKSGIIDNIFRGMLEDPEYLFFKEWMITIISSLDT